MGGLAQEWWSSCTCREEKERFTSQLGDPLSDYAAEVNMKIARVTVIQGVPDPRIVEFEALEAVFVDTGDKFLTFREEAVECIVAPLNWVV